MPDIVAMTNGSMSTMSPRLNAHANTEIEKIPVYTKKEIEEIYAAQDAEKSAARSPAIGKMLRSAMS